MYTKVITKNGKVLGTAKSPLEQLPTIDSIAERPPTAEYKLFGIWLSAFGATIVGVLGLPTIIHSFVVVALLSAALLLFLALVSMYVTFQFVAMLIYDT